MVSDSCGTGILNGRSTRCKKRKMAQQEKEEIQKIWSRRFSVFRAGDARGALRPPAAAFADRKRSLLAFSIERRRSVAGSGAGGGAGTGGGVDDEDSSAGVVGFGSRDDDTRDAFVSSYGFSDIGYDDDYDDGGDVGVIQVVWT